MAGKCWQAVVIASALACSRAPSKQSQAPSASARASTQAPAHPEHSIVWAELPNAATPRSYWIETNAGKSVVRGEAEGAVFVSRGGIYVWEKTTATRKILRECPEYLEAPGEQAESEEGAPASDPKNVQEVEVVGAVAKRLDEPGSFEIAGLPNPQNATMYGNTISLLASFGRLMLIDTGDDAHYCMAAHGSTSNATLVFDLERRETISFPTQQDSQALREQALRTHREELLKCVVSGVRNPDGTPVGAEGLERLEVQSATPKWSASGELTFNVTLGVLVSHVEGYLVPCDAEVRVPPPTFAKPAPPRAVADFARQSPKAVLRGWSTLDADQRDRIGAIAKVFTEAAKPAPNQPAPL